MIVPLEKQVASLEPMQELIGLGLKVDSLFVYATNPVYPDGIELTCNLLMSSSILAPALTVAELGVLFRAVKEDDLGLAMDELLGPHVSPETLGRDILVAFTTKPDFLCGLLIWLINHNRVTVEELNK